MLNKLLHLSICMHMCISVCIYARVYVCLYMYTCIYARCTVPGANLLNFLLHLSLQLGCLPVFKKLQAVAQVRVKERSRQRPGQLRVCVVAQDSRALRQAVRAVDLAVRQPAEVRCIVVKQALRVRHECLEARCAHKVLGKRARDALVGVDTRTRARAAYAQVTLGRQRLERVPRRCKEVMLYRVARARALCGVRFRQFRYKHCGWDCLLAGVAVGVACALHGCDGAPEGKHVGGECGSGTVTRQRLVGLLFAWIRSRV